MAQPQLLPFLRGWEIGQEWLQTNNVSAAQAWLRGLEEQLEQLLGIAAVARAELLEERLDLIFLSPEDATDVVHIGLRNCRANHLHPRLQ